MKALYLLQLNQTALRIVILSIIFILVSGLMSFASAQHLSSNIQGVIVDESKNPVDYVTVNLVNVQDSSVVDVVFSNEEGKYRFENIKGGRYRIVASMIGFNDGKSERIQLSVNESTRVMEDILLTSGNTSLKEVVVTGQRPLIERKADMLVVNVANSALAAGNTALDILERSPGITVDKDDNISLQGKQGVMVMIDGKPTHLSASQLANLLRSTDGNTIQSVEIIAHPSAKYDAEGTSGIINITLKKNKQAGTNGNLTLSGGYGNNHKVNSSLNINHKSGRLNAFGTYSYLNNQSEQLLGIYRIVGDGAKLTRFDQLNTMEDKRNNHSLRTGISYQTADRNTLGVELSGNSSHSMDNNVSNTLIGSHAIAIDSTLRSRTERDEYFNSFSINLNNTFAIDTMGRKLSAEADISRFEEDNDANYGNLFYSANGAELGDALVLRSGMPSIILIQSAKVDYVHPLNQDSKLEVGVKFARVNTDNDMKFERQVSEQWENMPERTNHFVYDEQVAAIYLNYHISIKKLGIQAGLRTEYTTSDGNSITLQNRVQREYVDFFPNVSIQFNASTNHQLGLTYGRRINRPNYSNLNPFLYFLDEFTYARGNPYLQPEYTDAFGLNYTLLNRFNFSLGYDITKDAMAEMMEQDDVKKTTTVYRDNFASSKNWYATVNAPFSLGKFWSSNTNITAFYLGFKGEGLAYPVDNGQFAAQLTSNHTFSLTPTLKAEATLNYQSPLTYSIYKIGQQWSVDAGLSQSFLDKKASLKLAVSDVLNTRTQSVATQYANLNAEINRKSETRVVRLTLSYGFGSTKIGTAKQDRKSEEESRVGK